MGVDLGLGLVALVVAEEAERGSVKPDRSIEFTTTSLGELTAYTLDVVPSSS